MSERDTKFMGFANLLWDDLVIQGRLGMKSEFQRDTRDPEFVEELKRIIARRAYDLAYHVIKDTSQTCEIYESHLLATTPDLTKWPEQSQDSKEGTVAHRKMFKQGDEVRHKDNHARIGMVLPRDSDPPPGYGYIRVQWYDAGRCKLVRESEIELNMSTRRITQEEIDWIKEGIEMHLDLMITQLQFYAKGEHPEGQIIDPRNKARYEAHAIEYLLNDVKACLQYGKSIPMIKVKPQ